MAAKKPMSTGKKVAVGALFTAAVGAILCYFFCPCFKKKGAALTEGGVSEDSFGSYGGESGVDGQGGAPELNAAPGSAPGIGWSGPVHHAIPPQGPLQVPAPLTKETIVQQLVSQRNLSSSQHRPVTII